MVYIIQIKVKFKVIDRNRRLCNTGGLDFFSFFLFFIFLEGKRVKKIIINKKLLPKE